LRETLLFFAVAQPEQHFGVAGRETSVGNQLLHRRRQSEQAQRVADRRAVLAHACCELVMRQAEIFDQLLVGSRLFERAQIFAMHVFDKRLLGRRRIRRVAHDHRHLREPGTLCGLQSALAGDELKGTGSQGPYEQRLQHADGANRVGEFIQRIVVEVRARLVRIEFHGGNRHLSEATSDGRHTSPAGNQ